MRKTQQLIDDLHKLSMALGTPRTPINTQELIDVMEESAERLFELEERIAIMTEGKRGI